MTHEPMWHTLEIIFPQPPPHKVPERSLQRSILLEMISRSLPQGLVLPINSGLCSQKSTWLTPAQNHDHVFRPRLKVRVA